MDYQYNQEIKNKSREKLIKHAIKSLTTKRKQSFLLTKEHFSKITDHFNSLLFSTKEWNELDFEFRNQYNWLFWGGKESWSKFYDSNCKPKSVNDLKVLYLSGPEPYNDIDVLCSNGIRLENIWAIESDKATYEKAVKSLVNAGIQIKIHRGNLSEFFELTNHEFDIIYFDACSPILSPQQSPLETLKQIFLNKRLSGLSALITNFAEPGDNYNWGEILAAWFGTRDSLDNPASDDEFGGIAEKTEFYKEYCQLINSHLPEYYDKFITSFIPTLGSEIIPMWQLTSLGSVQSNHLLNEQLLSKELKSIRSYECQADTTNDFIRNVQHFLLAIDAYPLLNWARIIRETFPKNHPLNIFLNSNRRKITIEDALYIGSLLKRFEEAQTGFKTFIYNVCGDKLKETMMALDFFDRHMRITCDTPMKNLLVELLIGLYGYPYIAHAGKNLSLKYKAKETSMYSNVFIFDQCRYLYDFMPTLDLWESFFQNLANQTIIRGCIDGIRRNHFQLNTSLFKWGFIEGVYGNEFGQAMLSDRVNLNDDI
ncbi:class I SAM-dependent methyltransferase [Sunxiuqinia dokdonensis]|uniref:Methyltransferase domain-containing protein n=1 Tax=Sunxiuqinia dokdonensis TaxID=1409788 RepID=A0A0L8V4X0_9BACT|nr:class I SAM-dependent methyltransferase [Sunxiuqinia dokdonensis]KOH43486.1 hypothetical protein NC99_36990 [Sunxiuqinia dokdonensis]